MNFVTFLITLLELSLCLSWHLFDNFPPDDHENENCIFVPYWYCKEDYSGLFEEQINIQYHPYSSVNEFDVCCKTDCGRREIVRKNSKKQFKQTYGNSMDIRLFGATDEAQFAEFPWMLGLILNGKYHCGASLIHPQIALTAAHCVISTGVYLARAGELNWESRDEPIPHQDRKIKKIIIHPNFISRYLLNDVAILELEYTFTLNTNVGVICLGDDLTIYDSSECVVTGWGKNSYFNKNYQPSLKLLNLSLIPINACTSLLQEASGVKSIHLHNSFICAGGKNIDACKGDGGSPLVCPIIGYSNRYVQVGIVAWGLTCGVTNAPGVYVNVRLFKDWIDAEIKRIGYSDSVYTL